VYPLKRAPRGGAAHCDDHFLGNRKLRARAATRAFPVARTSAWLRLGRLLHPARLEVRSTGPSLEAGNLIAQRRNHSAQLRDLFPLTYDQALQLGVR
jgi:hypothetical protein